MPLEFFFHDVQKMSEDVTSAFDRRSALPTRTNAEVGAFRAKNSLCCVVVEGTFTVRLQDVGGTTLHPTLAIGVQPSVRMSAGHSHASTESNTTFGKN